MNQGAERFNRGTVLLGLGAQRALFFLDTEHYTQSRESAEQGHDDDERGPTILVLLAGIEAEEGDDGHHGDSQTVVPERSGEGAGCGVDAALMGVGRDGGDHSPVGDIAQGVEHIEHHEHHHEQDDEQRGVDVDQAEQASVDHDDQHGGHQTADELPRAESPEFGGGVIHQVAQQRVHEDFRDTNDHDQRGDDADELARHGLVHSGEQRVGHIDHEVGA